jgi:hypothetical protein
LSLRACGSTTRDSLAPSVLTADPIPWSQWLNDLRPDEDAMIHHCSLPYIDESASFKYLTHIIIPYVFSAPVNPGLASEYVVVLMDSTSRHISERVSKVFGDNRIMSIVFPAHVTHLFQTLDLVLFDTLKTIEKTNQGDLGDDSVTDQIRKLLQAYGQVATSFTIRYAFRKAGITPDVTSRPVRLVFNQEVLQQNQGFSEICQFQHLY